MCLALMSHRSGYNRNKSLKAEYPKATFTSILNRNFYSFFFLSPSYSIIFPHNLWQPCLWFGFTAIQVVWWPFDCIFNRGKKGLSSFFFSFFCFCFLQTTVAKWCNYLTWLIKDDDRRMTGNEFYYRCESYSKWHRL